MTLNLDVSPQTKERLTSAALERGIDISSLVERLANDYLTTSDLPNLAPKSPADRIREIGFASFEPTDLSERTEDYLATGSFGETNSSLLSADRGYGRNDSISHRHAVAPVITCISEADGTNGQ